MAYEQYTYRLRSSNEIEIKYRGNYGAKGEKRAPKAKATPEQIKKQNQWKRETLVRRTVKLNFDPYDLWNTLKYPEGSRWTLQEVQQHLKSFFGKMRRRYKKRGQPFKYIYRLDISSRGGVHIHILINRLKGETDTDILIQECWPYGRVYYTNIYEQGGYEALAEYITKQPDEEMEGQLSLFPEEEQKAFRTYNGSRNLIRPEPEKKHYARRTLRKLFEDGPTPTPGYYIDKNSIICGTNPYTGMSYYHYTEIKLGFVDHVAAMSERRQE